MKRLNLQRSVQRSVFLLGIKKKISVIFSMSWSNKLNKYNIYFQALERYRPTGFDLPGSNMVQ
jgi:hypothetical protein